MIYCDWDALWTRLQVKIKLLLEIPHYIMQTIKIIINRYIFVKIDANWILVLFSRDTKNKKNNCVNYETLVEFHYAKQLELLTSKQVSVGQVTLSHDVLLAVVYEYHMNHCWYHDISWLYLWKRLLTSIRDLERHEVAVDVFALMSSETTEQKSTTKQKSTEYYIIVGALAVNMQWDHSIEIGLALLQTKLQRTLSTCIPWTVI